MFDRKAYMKAWRAKNKELIRATNSEYRKEHRQELIDYCKQWRLNNPEYYKRKSAAYCRASTNRRRIAKLNRTPCWLTEGDWIEMDWAYELATARTRITGIEHQVDHIIPLCGKNVSGLHVPANLQIITKSENCRKHNSFSI